MTRPITSSRALLGFFLAASVLHADTDPRDVIPAPAGTDAFIFYRKDISTNYTYSNGNKIRGFDLTANMNILRPVHYADLGGHVYSLQLLLPYGSMSLDGSAVGNAHFQTSGLGDTQLNFTYWFKNDTKQNRYAGAGLFLVTPTGAYDKSSPINLGDHRWSLRPQVLVGRGFGKAFYELGGEISVYTDKQDEGADQNLTSKKAPLYNAFGHATYNFTPALFTSASAFYTNGGETKLGGINQNDETKSLAAMLTFGFGLTAQSQLLLQIRQDVAVQNGPAQNHVDARFAYFF
jgi:hypothetical protein